MTRPDFWRVVGEVDSDSEPGVLHLIKKHKTTGWLSCDCSAYRFARGYKTCKHVGAYQSVTLRSEIRTAMNAPVVDPIAVPTGPTFSMQSMSRPGVRRLRLRDT